MSRGKARIRDLRTTFRRELTLNKHVATDSDWLERWKDLIYRQNSVYRPRENQNGATNPPAKQKKEDIPCHKPNTSFFLVLLHHFTSFKSFAFYSLSPFAQQHGFSLCVSAFQTSSLLSQFGPPCDSVLLELCKWISFNYLGGWREKG